MARRAWWVVLLAVLVAACGTRVAAPTTTSPGDTVPVHALAKHRVVSDISLDGGALTAQPPGNAEAGFSLSRADRVVLAAYTSVGASTTYDPTLVALARVSLSVKHSDGLPAYHNRLAWMAFFEQFTAPPCPSAGVSTGGSHPPFFYVTVLDAQTGKDALTYQTRGIGDCGGPVRGPYLGRATELLSVPWMAVGKQPLPPSSPVYLPGGNTEPIYTTEWTIRYTIPACGRLRTVSGPGPNTLYVDVETPVDPPSHCSGARTVTATVPAESGGLLHAPTGLTSGVVMNGTLVIY